MSSSALSPGQEDQALVSVRPRLRTVGRGGRIASAAGRESSHEDNLLSGLSVARLGPLRPPLVSGLPSAPACSGLTSRPGPVQQLLQQQAQHQQLVPLTERDRQIAMVEEELNLTRRKIELEKREMEVDRMVNRVDEQRSSSDLNGFGRFVNEFQENGNLDMIEQIEKARREELAKLRINRSSQGSSIKTNTSQSTNGFTKQKVREMLERKKREMSLRNGTFSSAGSSLKESFLRNIEVQKSGNEVFDSNKENKSSRVETVAISHFSEKYFDVSNSLGGVDEMVSVLGEDIGDQQRLWERIQRERREEEERVRGMKHNDVVQEQQEILRKIQEQNSARKKEEELTFRLISEMSLNDQRQELQRRNVASVSATRTVLPVAARAAPPSSSSASADQWSVVGARANEKLASLKFAAELDLKRREAADEMDKKMVETAAIGDWRRDMLVKEEEERRRQIRTWKESQKIRVVKSVDSFQDTEDSRSSTTFRDVLMNSQEAEQGRSSKSGKDGGGRRELGARRKSEGLPESKGVRRKAAEDVRLRTVTQDREMRSRVEKEALEREWELATQRKESRQFSATRASGQEGSVQGSRHTKLEQMMNQKLRKK